MNFTLFCTFTSFRNVHSDKISVKTIFLNSSWRQISSLLLIFLMSKLNISVGWYVGETQEPLFVLKNSECFHSLGFRISVARLASAGKSLHLSIISQHNCHTSWQDFSSSTITLADLPILCFHFFQFSPQLGSL